MGAGLAAAAPGTPPLIFDLTSGGVWLTSESAGTVTHLQSTTGRADAAVTVPGAVGHRLSVLRNGPDLLVCDADAGLLHLIEPQRLAPARTATLRPGTTVTAANGVVYAVDGASGRVQRLDGRLLTGLGPVVDLGGALGAVAQSVDGTLWAPVRTSGSVVMIRDGVASPPIPVARPDHQIDVVLAHDHPVVVDGTTGTAIPITGDRPGQQTALPVTLTTASTGPPVAVIAAAAVERSTVPVLDTVAGRLLLADVHGGEVTVHDLPTRPGGGRVQLGEGTARPGGGPAQPGGGPARPGGGDDSVSTDPAAASAAAAGLPDIERPAGGDEDGGPPAPRRLGPPTWHDGAVYIPDQDARMVWVFDTRTGGFTAPIVVPGIPPGPGTGAARITVTAEGDQVWVNDPAGPDAVLIDGARRATVAKRPSGLPGQTGTT
ncbi:hypothetical protein, partial [Frankia gtarii]|uniref:hypothetical protein n=1 Tax=Frankia gtarii TaxID=2950102 RepID=UPI0021C16505